MKARGLMWCGMLLMFIHGALAETLRVQAMSLSPAAAWQRGDPAQEKREAVYWLEWPIPQGVVLQVAVPHQAMKLNTDAEVFYANLRKKWLAQHGKHAEIGKIEIGSARWLACRYPASAGGAIVFQLATVHAGSAYSVLVFASPQAVGLPQPVFDLLAGASFGTRAPDWVLTRVISAQPGREALKNLVQGDADRLDQHGMLTGYGIDSVALADAPGHRLAWFMDGFNWHTRGGRDQRLPIGLRGHLDVRMPARVKGSSVLVPISLHHATESGSGLELEVSRLDLCAPAANIDDALIYLTLGIRTPLERLATCPATSAAPAPSVLLVSPGETASQTLELALALAPPLATGLERIQVISLRLRRVGEGDEMGQNLLRQLGLYFVFVPE